MAGRITIATVSINDPTVEMRVDGARNQAAGFLPTPDGRQIQLTLQTEDLGDDLRKGNCGRLQTDAPQYGPGRLQPSGGQQAPEGEAVGGEAPIVSPPKGVGRSLLSGR